MTEYIKIETPFERDKEGSKKLIEGKWRNETIQYLRNTWWQFTEKIDGTNISIVWDGHKAEFHGRTERAQIPAHLANRLSDLFGGSVNEELFEQTFGGTPMILYGEGYGAKIQNGGLYRDDVDFILFDVYQPDSDIWLKRESIEGIAKIFGIDIVPIVLEGDIDTAIDFVRQKPMSTIGKAPMEGLVGRPEVELKDRFGNRIIVKIKTKDFV